MKGRPSWWKPVLRLAISRFSRTAFVKTRRLSASTATWRSTFATGRAPSAAASSSGSRPNGGAWRNRQRRPRPSGFHRRRPAAAPCACSEPPDSRGARSALFDRFERLIEVRQQVLGILDPDGDPDEARRDAESVALLLRD